MMAEVFADLSFWARVDIRGHDECWEWQGTRASGGYGRYRRKVASRIALESRLGRELVDGEFACHTCDNPPCVNPSHLWPGTSADNARDMVLKGRSYRRTHCKKGHALTEDNFRTRPSHPTRRSCLTCYREHVKIAKRAKDRTKCKPLTVSIDGEEILRLKLRTVASARRIAWERGLQAGQFTSDQESWFMQNAIIGRYDPPSHGQPGVNFHKPSGRWRAVLTINRRCRHLGAFTNYDDAVRARLTAEAALGFSPLRRKRETAS